MWIIFQKPFLFVSNNRSYFSFTNLKSIIFSLTRTDLFFFVFFFFHFTKTDLMFTNQILFSKLNKKQIWFFLIKSCFLPFTQKQIWFFYKPSLIFLIFKTDLNILLKEDIIHKENLFKLIFVKCLSCMFNISFNIIQKWYIGH